MSKERVVFTVEMDIDCATWRREYFSDEPNENIIRAVQDRMLYYASETLGSGVNIFSVRREPSS